MEPVPRLAWLPGPGPSTGALPRPSVVQGFRATLEQVATLWKTGQDKSPACEGET